jgi:hypothetical protein
MGSSTISLGLGLGGGKSATSSGTSGGGGAYPNFFSGSFDGSDDHLLVDERSLAPSDGDCTISLWFNSASLPGSANFDYMFSLTNGTAVFGADRAVGIRGTGTDAQIVCNAYGPSSGYNQPFTNTSISADRWYHVAAIFSASAGTVRVYLDGVDKGTQSITIAVINDARYSKTAIGGMLYLASGYFNGKIDEVSVFHSALSSSDIESIYNDGVPGDLSTLSPKGWWRNGDGTGDTASGGGAPANTSVIGTVANQGSVNTGSGEGNMAGTNDPTYSNSVPSS